jgi:hypothetical protein
VGSLRVTLAANAHVLVRGRLRLSETAATLRDQPDLLADSYHLTGTSV